MWRLVTRDAETGEVLEDLFRRFDRREDAEMAREATMEFARSVARMASRTLEMTLRGDGSVVLRVVPDGRAAALSIEEV